LLEEDQVDQTLVVVEVLEDSEHLSQAVEKYF
jgi:hypothetical protein